MPCGLSCLYWMEGFVHHASACELVLYFGNRVVLGFHLRGHVLLVTGKQIGQGCEESFIPTILDGFRAIRGFQFLELPKGRNVVHCVGDLGRDALPFAFAFQGGAALGWRFWLLRKFLADAGDIFVVLEQAHVNVSADAYKLQGVGYGVCESLLESLIVAEGAVAVLADYLVAAHAVHRVSPVAVPDGNRAVDEYFLACRDNLE